MSNFPTGLDSFTTKVDDVDYVVAAHVNDLQAAIVAAQTKAGITNSVDTNSLDYKVANSLKIDQTTPQTTVGTFTFPKVVATTDLTTPLVIGGSAVDSVLQLKGTIGNGTLTSPAIQALVGNNGATTALTVLNNGNVGIGTTSPGFPLTLEKDAIAATPTTSTQLQNATLSTSIATQQFSPSLQFTGHAWNTTTVTADNQLDARQYLSVTSGLTPTSTLSWGFQRAAGGYTDKMTLTDGGVLTATTFVGALTGTASGNLTAANIEDNITDGHTTIAPSGNAVFDALALKAPLNSPTFTGTPTLPTGSVAVTQTANDNSTKLATTAYADRVTGVWTSFTPNWTYGVTVGNATQVASYCVIGKTVFYTIRFTFGTTTAFTGAYILCAIPYGTETGNFIGNVTIEDYQTAIYTGAAAISGTGINPQVLGTSSTYASGTNFTSTVPFTWTTNDYFFVSGFYEIS